MILLIRRQILPLSPDHHLCCCLPSCLLRSEVYRDGNSKFGEIDSSKMPCFPHQIGTDQIKDGELFLAVIGVRYTVAG